MTKRVLLPILDDQPAKEDYLDFNSYAEALHDLIISPNTQTPLTLGIFGRWGTGKTTLMHLLERKLNPKKTGNQQRMLTVWFSAWQYNKESELWAAFLQSVINKIETELNVWQKLLYKCKLLVKRIEWNNIPGALLKYLLRAIIVILPLLLIDPITQDIQTGAQEIILIGGNIAAAGLAIWLVIKPLLETIQDNVTIDFRAIQQESDYKKHIAFLDKFREHFNDIVQSLPTKDNKRLGVFIDDLDRCSPDRILQVLDVIKLFVDVPGCVFVLGLDSEITLKAIETKYKDDPVAKRDYLSKIIQLPFQLPPLTPHNMGNFLERLDITFPDKKCNDVFLLGLVANPREVKRTINVFSLLWNLANTRSELAGKVTPVRLAKIVVIQHAYPQLHKILQEQPYLLIELERYFRKSEAEKKSAADQPEKRVDLTPQLVTVKHEVADRGSITLEGYSDEWFTSTLDWNYEKRRGGELLAVSQELQAYTSNELLRRILLLHDLVEDEETVDNVNFVDLDHTEVSIYFTLTSQVEQTESFATEQLATETTISAGIGLPSTTVTIGHPKYCPIEDLMEFDQIDHSIASQDAKFYLVKLAFSIRPTRNMQIDKARLSVHLKSITGDESSVVFDLFPQKVEQTTELRVGLSPNLRFTYGTDWHGIRIEYPHTPWLTMGFGIGESAAFWEFQSGKGKSLWGHNFVYFILRKPKSAEAVRLQIAVETAGKSRWFGSIWPGAYVVMSDFTL